MYFVSRHIALLSLCVLYSGCGDTNESSTPHMFLGLPDNESSGEGPAGLIDGESARISNVSKVQEVSRQEYLSAKEAGSIVAEEQHHGYIYWAVEVERDIPFENASAWVVVLERFKSKLQ